MRWRRGGDWEYMRGDWGVVCGRVAERLEQHGEEEPTTSMAVFNTLEDLRGESAVHAAVVAEAARGGEGAGAEAGGSAGGERGAAHRESEHGASDGGGDGDGGVPMLPVVGGARDRESSRARGEMMPRVTLARTASGGRVKRTVIGKRSGGKAVAYAEERHARGEARRGPGGRRTGDDGGAAEGGGVDGADMRGVGGRGAKRRLFDDEAGGGEDDARGADAEVTDSAVS